MTVVQRRQSTSAKSEVRVHARETEREGEEEQLFVSLLVLA